MKPEPLKIPLLEQDIRPVTRGNSATLTISESATNLAEKRRCVCNTVI